MIKSYTKIDKVSLKFYQIVINLSQRVFVIIISLQLQLYNFAKKFLGYANNKQIPKKDIF